MDQTFETLLANHCAPVLCKKKPAALLPEKHLPPNCPWALLKNQGFHLFRLCWRGHTLALIYHPTLLQNTLSQNAVRQNLAKLGYPTQHSWRTMLRFLRQRFCLSNEFPHEVGFFLGYPPDDVVGFIHCKNNCTADCKLCGPWKVFGDVDQATALFEEYARCKATLLHHIKSGGSIFNADLPALAG